MALDQKFLLQSEQQLRELYQDREKINAQIRGLQLLVGKPQRAKREMTLAESAPNQQRIVDIIKTKGGSARTKDIRAEMPGTPGGTVSSGLTHLKNKGIVENIEGIWTLVDAA